MNVAEYLVKQLEKLGINDFFGLPGDYNFNILYAVENNSATKWIGCTNELNAAYAADGYARQRGYGAVITTYGVGELGAISGIAGSYAENVPVVSIVGIPSTKDLSNNKLLHHNLLDLNVNAFLESYKNVTSTTTILNRDNAKLEIDRVLKVLVKYKKPVYIAIPMDIAELEISEREIEYEWYSDESILKDAVEKITSKINNSTNPILFAGILTKRFDADLEINEFLQNSNIPAASFLMGANIIDKNYSNNLGIYFNNHANLQVKNILKSSDCIITVGTICSDLNSYKFNFSNENIPDIEIYGTYTIIDGIKYENIKMKDVLSSLTKTVKKRDNIKKEELNYYYEKETSTTDKLTSNFIYSSLQEFLQPNDILVTETGLLNQGIAQIKFPENVQLHSQLLWAAIGWATPATLGISLAKPNNRIILISGEGAHQLTALEIGNMLRNGLKPIVIIINNKGYTIERLLSGNIDDKFNDIVDMNYSKFARIFDGDVWTTKVNTKDEFEKALRVTQIMNKMCYIEACIDKMNIPELAQKVFYQQNKTEEKVNNETTVMQKINKEDNSIKQQTEYVKLSTIDMNNFSTTVHENLREIE